MLTAPNVIPVSSPVAVNVPNDVVFCTDVLPVPDGNASVMYDGTVNCPAATGATHV
jgi:hypothetical protein